MVLGGMWSGIVGTTMALGFLFGNHTESFEGLATVKLKQSFTQHSHGYGTPVVEIANGKAVVAPLVYRGYRLVRGGIHDYNILSGLSTVYPVILDVSIFSPTAAESDLTAFRHCFSTELWGMGGCGSAAREFGGDRGTLEASAKKVLDEGSISLFEPNEPPGSHWHDSGAKAKPVFGFTAIDRSKKVRLDLYCSHGLYSKEQARELILAAIRSFKVEPDKVAAALTTISDKLEKDRALLQREFDAIATGIKPLGLSLEKGNWALAPDGSYVSVDFQNGHINDIKLSVSIGTVVFPAATRFTQRERPKIRFVPSQAKPVALAAWYWDSRPGRDIWNDLDLFHPELKDHPGALPLPDEVKTRWKNKNEVHLYFQRRLRGDLNAEGERVASYPDFLAKEFAAAIETARAIRRQHREGRLVERYE